MVVLLKKYYMPEIRTMRVKWKPYGSYYLSFVILEMNRMAEPKKNHSHNVQYS